MDGNTCRDTQCRLAGSLICWLQHLLTVEDVIMHRLADEIIFLNVGIKNSLAFFGNQSTMMSGIRCTETL